MTLPRPSLTVPLAIPLCRPVERMPTLPLHKYGIYLLRTKLFLLYSSERRAGVFRGSTNTTLTDLSSQIGSRISAKPCRRILSFASAVRIVNNCPKYHWLPYSLDLWMPPHCVESQGNI